MYTHYERVGAISTANLDSWSENERTPRLRCLYGVAGIFRGGKLFVCSELFGQFVKIFSWTRDTKPHPGILRYCFVGKHFVFRLSATKTAKIVSPREIRVYYGYHSVNSLTLYFCEGSQFGNSTI